MDKEFLAKKYLCFLLVSAILVACANTPGREEPFAGIVTSIFSPDGKLIAAATSEGQVAMFDAQPLWFRRELTSATDKKPLSRSYGELVGATFRPMPLAFSPDGKVLVAAGVQGSIVGWEVEVGKELFRVQTDGSVREIAFLVDGSAFVTAGSRLTIRSSADGRVVQELPVATSAEGCSLAASQDGRLLMVGFSSGELAAYDVSKRSLLSSFKGHSAPVTGVAFKPDGTIFASTAGGYDLQFWKEKADGGFEKTLPPITAATVAQESVGLAQGASVLLWLLGTVSGAMLVGAPTMGAPPFIPGAETQFTKAARTTPYHCGSRVVFSANGRYVASTANLLVCADCVGRLAPAFMLFITDLESGTTATAANRGCSVSLSPDGRVVATGGAVGAPALLDSATGNPLPNLKQDHIQAR